MRSDAEYREILGIPTSASGEQFKQAYRDLVKVWHPDRFSDDPRLQRKAEEKLKEINEAYDQLQSYFSNNENRHSQQSNRPRSDPKSEEAQKPPPKSSPASTKQKEVVAWIRKWWYPATIILMFGFVLFFL